MKEALNIEQFDSMRDLKAKFNEICDCAYMGMRFYAVGSEKFVWNLRNCARGFGLSEEEISLEVVGSKAKDIDCSNCQTTNSSVRTNIILFPALVVK
ncbi:hypothetical protein [Hyella patelloides]|nr:hypothetical protein [Hyella patelloides]